MRIEFVGGARTVTGSSYIISGDGFTAMVDCGMFQGKRVLRERNSLNLIYKPEEIDVLLLTHAHVDHSGLIPKLVKNGFSSSIYATRATVDLCSIMLPDSGHIQEMDAEWVNRRNMKMGLEAVEPLYTVEDAEDAMQYFVPVKYGDVIEVHPNIKARFRDDGHILGSSFIELWVEEGGKTTKVVFSGDIGSRDQAIVRDPERAEEADILLIESTYGDRLHKSKKDTYEEFKNIILDSHNKKGNIVIPSFAVERTQEIIFTLGKLFKSGEMPSIPVYIDSPLAISATEVFRKNPECFDDEMKKILMSGDSPLDFPNLFFTRSTEESKKLNKEARGAIIISASGMCTAGRIKYHLQNNLYKPESSVIFVGYQAEGTLGRRLIDGAKRVRIYGMDVLVNAQIYTLGGFSAHADRNGLIDWMSSIKNDNLRVFVVHGEESASLHFAELVGERFSYETAVPRWGEIIDLETMESTFAQYSPAKELHEPVEGDLDELMNSMEKLIEKYHRARKENRIDEAGMLGQGIRELKQMLDTMSDEM